MWGGESKKEGISDMDGMWDGQCDENPKDSRIQSARYRTMYISKPIGPSYLEFSCSIRVETS